MMQATKVQTKEDDFSSEIYHSPWTNSVTACSFLYQYTSILNKVLPIFKGFFSRLFCLESEMTFSFPAKGNFYDAWLSDMLCTKPFQFRTMKRKRVKRWQHLHFVITFFVSQRESDSKKDYYHWSRPDIHFQNSKMWITAKEHSLLDVNGTHRHLRL